MSYLRLSWCQLIKIILSQIGGNPLQQIYTELHQGLPRLAPGGILPQGLAQIQQVVSQVTAAVQAAQNAANDFTDTLDRIAVQIYENPVGTVINGTQLAANARIATLDIQIAEANAIPNVELESFLIAERNVVANTVTTLQVFRQNTDRLSGVGGSISGGRGSQSCSLQDLLGSGCTPNDAVPDIDIKDLIESLKQGDAINAIKEKLENATGISDLRQQVASFNSTIQGFNSSFAAKLDKTAIKNAVASQLSQIVYNLLSGCGNEVLNLTLKKGVKDAIAPYVKALELQRDGGDYYDNNGELIDVDNLQDDVTRIVAADPPVEVDTNIATVEPRKYYLDGIEVTEEQYIRQQELYARRKAEANAANPLTAQKENLETKIKSLREQIKDLQREEQRVVELAKGATGQAAFDYTNTIQRLRNTINSRTATLGELNLQLSEVILQIERTR